MFGTTRVVRAGEDVHLGGRRPAEVLALLVAAEGRVLDRDVLAERLWRGASPDTAQTTLHGHVARLRRALEPGRGARQAEVVVTHGTGYRLAIGRSDVDIHDFADRVNDVRDRLRNAPLQERADALSEALERWRGEPFADVADVLDVRPAVTHLEELRLWAVEELAEAKVALGAAAAIVPELAAVAAEHPLRERTHVLLARALYAAGRQTEALEVLRSVTRQIAGEYGLDPTPELRALESAILRQDSSLDAPTPVPATQVPATPVPAIRTKASRASGSHATAEAHGTRRARPAAYGLLEAGAAPREPGDDFVGRREELTALEAVWASVAHGRGSAAVVTGEPGMGKTRLIEAFAARVGTDVRWGRCAQTPGAPPYWPWTQVLGTLPDNLAWGDSGARFAVGLEVGRRIDAMAASAPTLVVIDDLQWCDADSLSVLEVVLSRLQGTRALVALTCRADVLAEPRLTPVLAAASRLPGATRLALEGLPVDDVLELVARSRTVAPGPDEASAIAARCAGNPLFVTQVAALPPGQSDRVPDTVRDVVRLRLSTLGPAARELVAATAIATNPVSLAVLASTLGISVSDASLAAAEARRAGLVVEAPQQHLRMSHDLLLDAVAADTPVPRCIELHLSLAAALDASPGAPTSAAAIAIHRSEAAVGAVDETAARACLLAAEEALARSAPADAAVLAVRGLAHVPRTEPALEGDLEQVRAVAKLRLGLIEEGTSAFRAAAECARRAGDPTRLARAALGSAGGGIGGYWASLASTSATDVPLLEEVAALDGLADGLRAEVLAALAIHRASVGVGAIDLAHRAERTALAAGSASPRAAVATFVTRWTPEHASERVRLARAMVRRAHDGLAHEATSLHLLRATLLETLEVEEFGVVSERLTRLVSNHGDGDLLLLDLWRRAELELARGEWAAARTLADEAVAMAPSASPAAAEVIRMSRQTIEGIIAWHEHRLPEVVPEALDLATSVDPSWLGVLAQAHAQAGRRERADAAAQRLLELPGAGVREPVHAILLADVAIELKDVDRARSLLPILERYGDTVVVLWAGTTILGPTALYRGGLKAVLGDQGASADLVRATDISDTFGFKPFADRSRRLLAGL